MRRLFFILACLCFAWPVAAQQPVEIRAGSVTVTGGAEGPYNPMDGRLIDPVTNAPVVYLAADKCAGTKLMGQVGQTTGTQVVTGTASMRIFLCSIILGSATAQSIAIVSGTGTVCATSLGAVLGGVSAATGIPVGVTGGWTYGNGAAWIAKTDTDAENLCVLQSGSGQLTGSFTYVVTAN